MTDLAPFKTWGDVWRQAITRGVSWGVGFVLAVGLMPWSWIYHSVLCPIGDALAWVWHGPGTLAAYHPGMTLGLIVALAAFLICFRVKVANLLEAHPQDADTAPLKKWAAGLDLSMGLGLALAMVTMLSIGATADLNEDALKLPEEDQAQLIAATHSLPGGSFDDRVRWANSKLENAELKPVPGTAQVQVILDRRNAKTCEALVAQLHTSTVWRVQRINDVEVPAGLPARASRCMFLANNTVILQSQHPLL